MTTSRHDLTPGQIAVLLRLSEAVERDWLEMADQTGSDWSAQTDALLNRPAHRTLVNYIKHLPARL